MHLRLDMIGIVLDTFLQLASLVAVLAFLVRLGLRGLLAKYWVLSLYFVIVGAASCLRFWAGMRVESRIWELTEAAKLAVSFVIFGQASRAIFARYPALGAFANKTTGIALAVCALAGVLSFVTDPDPAPGRSPLLQLFIAAQRAVVSGLLLFLVVLSVFAGWFPIRLTRNTARFLIGFLALFAADWACAFTANVSPGLTHWANIAYSLVFLTTVLYWAVMVGPEGEMEEDSVRSRWDPARMERLTLQLDQMESQLARRGF